MLSATGSAPCVQASTQSHNSSTQFLHAHIVSIKPASNFKQHAAALAIATIRPNLFRWQLVPITPAKLAPCRCNRGGADRVRRNGARAGCNLHGRDLCGGCGLVVEPCGISCSRGKWLLDCFLRNGAADRLAVVSWITCHHLSSLVITLTAVRGGASVAVQAGATCSSDGEAQSSDSWDPPVGVWGWRVEGR